MTQPKDMAKRAKPSKASETVTRTETPTPAVRFVDFAVRAWREGPYVQVIAHSTPAGAMRQPVAVKLGKFAADDFRIAIDAPLADAAAVGRSLARLVFPPGIWRLLGESLAGIGSRRELGLRIRLCLDDDLIDLPWEFLYRPDVDAPAAQSGFLLTDGRISLTREPPSMVGAQVSNDRVQRALFLGTMWDDGSDGWSVRSEYASLEQAMQPIGDLLKFEFIESDDFGAVEKALADGCDVFHYAGHTDVTDGQGTLVHRVRAATLKAFDEAVGRTAVPSVAIPGPMEAVAKPAAWSSSEVLAARLARGRTRLAVFNACNSGLWPFVQPLMRAGIPAVIGVQGLVSNVASLNFAEKFYQSLAVGLSLDEALTYARLYVMQPGRSYHPCDWGRFMAYLPTDSAVLFPRPEQTAMRERQNEVRAGRTQTVGAMTKQLDGEGVSRMLSEVASRSVLILGRFTLARKPILELIRREISTKPRQYVPILFDFDRPHELTMLESVLRFAAVSRFVIADLSDPKWVLAEFGKIVGAFNSLPIVPIIHASQREDEVVAYVEGFRSAHKVVRYRDEAHLRSILDSEILKAGETLHDALKPRVVIY
jgi:hypothetical protein